VERVFVVAAERHALGSGGIDGLDDDGLLQVLLDPGQGGVLSLGRDEVLLDGAEASVADALLHELLVASAEGLLPDVGLGQVEVVADLVLEGHAGLAADDPLEDVHLAALELLDDLVDVLVLSLEDEVAGLRLEVVEGLQTEDAHDLDVHVLQLLAEHA
jgi:hypothetical protein